MVERVLPLKPTAAWLESFSKEEHAAWVGRAANLALLAAEPAPAPAGRTRRSTTSSGSGSGCASFEAVKEAWPERARAELGGDGVSAGTVHGLPLTADVLRCEHWTPAVLERRQRVLLDLAADCWRLR